jgi:hypothetical protein
MSDPIESITSGTISGFLKTCAEEYRAFWHRRRQKRTLRSMLNDDRFGYRSTPRLAQAIAADEDETSRLLLAIGARRSEISEEWTLKPPPRSRRRQF